MLQMALKPHSTEPFRKRIICEAEDICDDAVTEGFYHTAKSNTKLRASSDALHGKITFDAATTAGSTMDISGPSMVLTPSRQRHSTSLRIRTREYKPGRCIGAYTTDLYESGGTTCVDKLGLLRLNSLGM